MSRIQLIEADAKQEEVLRSQLQDHGFQVVISSDIEEARRKLHEIVPDLLVISLNIDDSLFFDFYRWLCNTFPWSKIPRLFISGNKLTEIARELEIEENEEIFSKPIDIARFISTIKKLISTRSGAFKKTDEDYLAAVPGRKIGSVIIKEEIGRGGMGAVFLGYQETLERKVAVKLLLPGMIGDPFAAQRFQREAVAIAGLKSPHIVQIFDFGEIDHNVFYICMEYLEGETLEQYLKKHGKFSIKKAISIVSQVARGLIVAHDAQLVHRDIKPSNLIMNAKNHVTITDFGLVRPQKKTEQTQSGMIVGSPHYIPPEQASGKPMDARSDIYSLGIIFYQLIVGKVPFTDDNPIKIVMQHMNDPLPDPRNIVRDIPEKVVKIVRRMTEKAQAERYPNCRELLGDLESIDLYDDKTIAAPFLRDQTPSTKKTNKASVNTRLEKKFLELSRLLPTLINREKLLGSVTMTPSGAFLHWQGQFPDDWKNNLSILQDNINQVNTAVNLGKWRFLFVHTAGHLAALFPEDRNVEALFFAKGNCGTISKTSISKKSQDSQNKETDINPIRRLSSIAGVQSIFLFNREGELTGYYQVKGNTNADYRHRLSPAALVIQSLPLEISSMDLWFKKGRVLIWTIDTGILFVTADIDISYSFLSIFIASNLEHLNRATQKRTSLSENGIQNIHELNGLAPADFLDRIRLELARMIGPIGKVVFDKEINNTGFSKDTFPIKQVPVLIEELAKKIGPDERQTFKDKVQELIYSIRGKSQ